jgi:type I restriction enzyme S subunit
MNKEIKILPELRFPDFEKDGEWTVSSIDELCDILNNIRKPVTSTNRTAGPYPYYGASGIIDFIDKFLFDERLLLIGEDGAKWGAYDNTAFLVEGKYWVNNHAHVLKPIRIDEKLLESYLVKLDLNPYITGAAPPKLTLRKLKEIPVPVPSTTEEQQKIASCLSSLDEVIELHTQKLELLQEHKKGLLQNLFPQEGERVPKFRFPEFENDGEWVENELGKICDVRDGTHDSPKYVSDGYPLITSKNLLENGAMDFENVSYLTQEDYDKINQRSKVDVGDILFGMIGTIGNPVIVKRDGFAIKNVALIKTKGLLEQEYLIQLLKSNYIDIQFQKANAGGILKFIALGMIRKLIIPTPKKEEQQKIASCLSALDELIMAQAEKIEQLKMHKKGLMQGLFPSAV